MHGRPKSRSPVELRCLARCGLVALAAISSPALSAGPEQLEQLEPAGGEWQFEYSTLMGVHSEDEHSLQGLLGLSDHLAIGLEVETEWSGSRLTFDGVAPTILYRFSDDSNAIGVGIGAQVEIGGDLTIASTEARLIVAKRTDRWWAQGNLIARHVRDEGRGGTALAYSWGLSRSVGTSFWIGAEGSGQGHRLSGPASTIPDGGHFLGPSFGSEHEIAGSEVEFGIAWLHRIAGEGPRDAARLVVQFGL